MQTVCCFRGLQAGVAHQVFVNLPRACTAFCDAPNNEGLTAMHVTGGKDLVDIGLVAALCGFDVGALVELYAERLRDIRLGYRGSRLQ